MRRIRRPPATHCECSSTGCRPVSEEARPCSSPRWSRSRDSTAWNSRFTPRHPWPPDSRCPARTRPSVPGGFGPSQGGCCGAVAVLPRVVRKHDVLYSPGNFAVLAAPRPQVVAFQNALHFGKAGAQFVRRVHSGRYRARTWAERRLARISLRRATAAVVLSESLGRAIAEDIPLTPHLPNRRGSADPAATASAGAHRRRRTAASRSGRPVRAGGCARLLPQGLGWPYRSVPPPSRAPTASAGRPMPH